ncbi:hypothetical protein SE23_20095 [Vibrio sinaloensis]|uniref:hypothetical protein n=1 Tax=Photobacterium sp. (strain ATCC 43367) TaxID=379097 RepID=UPI00057CDF69|nr:hypothetical protein [Vibrio sinaloensis]KIE18858.1 hypothetical protein SE23_20095 [Vibrio sinaloensis]
MAKNNVIRLILLGLVALKVNATEYKVVGSGEVSVMNYYPATTIVSCTENNECTYLSLNSHAIANLLTGRLIENSMGENRNISAKAIRKGVNYFISEKSSSLLSARLSSHDPEGKKLKFTYSITLVSEDGRLIIEKNKTVVLLGSNYEVFLGTELLPHDIPNKRVLNPVEFLDVVECNVGDKYCFSELAYYTNYGLYLATLSMNLTQQELGSNTIAALEGVSKVVLTSINPVAAEFYGVPFDDPGSISGEEFSNRSVVLAIDANVEGRRYVGYARVNTNDGTSINYSVEETNESVIQYLTRACNSVRLGDFDKNVIDKYCDFGVKK